MIICTKAEAEKKLKETFKINHFYDDQWKVITKLFEEKRIVLVKKTGYGKSLCYQFPSLYFEGMTLVFSPLKALMNEQVKYLNSIGISSAFINSSNSKEENDNIILQALNNEIKILYITPEREKDDIWKKSVVNMKISMVVIDEAHVISVWGHDFRQSFRRIIDLIKILPKNLPILATTATATMKVKEDIADQIGHQAEIIHGELNRDNLYLKVIRVKTDDEKLIWLKNKLYELEGTGLIYVGTISETKYYYNWLNFLGISCEYYNGRRNDEERLVIEDGLKNNRWKCVVSTNALGMGLDKKDIRFIIHIQVPSSIIHYYQEIGRAGRDGFRSDIFLLFNESKLSTGQYKDMELPLAFIEKSRPNPNIYYKVIDLIKHKRLRSKEILMELNINKNMFETIKDDLLNQNIIAKVKEKSNTYYEYKYGAKPLDTEVFLEIKNRKYKELNDMIDYIYTEKPRMQYLCEYLNDSYRHVYCNCDNTNLDKEVVDLKKSDIELIKRFKNQSFPELELENKKIGLTNGVATSFYGTSHVGAIIHRCKYVSKEDFPDEILELLCNAFNSYFKDSKFDLLLYVPPTVSGTLVEHLAYKLSKKINIPLGNYIYKIRITDEQKKFQNGYLKKENVKNAFAVYDCDTIKNKRILLLDDIYDSGGTIKEVSKMLYLNGAISISPIVIAQTVGGDLV